jgi:hypothetical protein
MRASRPFKSAGERGSAEASGAKIERKRKRKSGR